MGRDLVHRGATTDDRADAWPIVIDGQSSGGSPEPRQGDVSMFVVAMKTQTSFG
jgi:hypothetical protein